MDNNFKNTIFRKNNFELLTMKSSQIGEFDNFTSSPRVTAIEKHKISTYFVTMKYNIELETNLSFINYRI